LPYEYRIRTAAQLDLAVVRRGDEIEMRFPVYETEPIMVPNAMLHALGVQDVVESAYSPTNKIIILRIPDAQLLAALQPDFRALVASYVGINGVLVTAAGTDTKYDYHYRYFWPWAGTDEDPVTGGVQTFWRSIGRNACTGHSYARFSRRREPGR
jgi:predicted PhzF superfamily epimerase YddE/YHI9